MTPHVTRRRLTQGAAWSLPVVAMAAAAPAYAASLQACPATGCLVHNQVSDPGWTLTAPPGGGSRVQMDLGSIYVDPNCAPAGTTGFMIEFTSVVATAVDGSTHVGRITAQPTLAPYVAARGAGGALWFAAVYDDFAYNGPHSGDPDWDSDHWLTSYAITYKITYLYGLDPLDALTAACPYTAVVTAEPNTGAYLTGTLSKIS